jgi:hypothetical protein
MSRTAIMAAALAKCAAIQDIVYAQIGKPGGTFPHTNTPLIWLGAQEINPQRLTFGDAGEVQFQWVIGIHIILAAGDISDEQVQELALVFADRLRAAFYSDDTLGGTCWDATLGEGENNLETYEISQDEFPEIYYPLIITEEIVANAVAS